MEANERIAQLEQQVDALRRELAEVKGPRSNAEIPHTSAPPQRQVTISHPLEKASLPSDEEFPLLLQRVLARYPSLRPDDERGFLGEFKQALTFCHHHGRRREIDRERSLGWWIDTCRTWCRQHGVPGYPVSSQAFVAAIIAAGDVQFTDPDEPGFSCALQFGGGGHPSGDWWRRVLSGTMLTPTELPQQVRVVPPLRRMIQR